MTVVLAGCGVLGQAVGSRFIARGRRVLGLRRTSGRLPASFDEQSVDLSAAAPVLPADTDVVVVALTADDRTETAYRATYVDGLANVLLAVERHCDVRPRILFVSSTAVYGQTDGSWVDEDSLTRPATTTGAVLVEAETMLRERYPDAVTLRLSGLYGPGRGESLLRQVRDETVRVSRLPHYTNRIHQDDAADAVVHLTTNLQHPAQVYLGSDSEPADRREVVRFLADQMGVAAPPPADEPDPRGMGKRCRNDRLLASGLTLRYPTYREGYRAVLAGRDLPSGARAPEG